MVKSTTKRNRKNFIILYFLVCIIIISIGIKLFSSSPIMFWQDVFNFISPNKSITTLSSNLDDNESTMSIHILDVGKADAIFINCNNSNILIDAGDIDVSNKVVEYLKKNNIQKLDFAVATHPHRDHIGHMPEVIDKFQIHKFMMPEVPDNIIPTGKTYKTMLENLSKHQIEVDKPVPGNKFYIDQMEINILGPINKYDNLNNNSVIVKILYGDTSFLFMGDAEKESENDLIKSGYDLKSDVLKVGHHGSKTSTTPKFLKAVSPEITVISVGPDNSNLPKEDIINRIKNQNIKLYRTDINGNININSDGKNIEVIVEKE